MEDYVSSPLPPYVNTQIRASPLERHYSVPSLRYVKNKTN